MAMRSGILRMPFAGMPPTKVSTIGMSLRLSGAEFNETIRNLWVVGEAITFQYARTVADILVNLLAKAQPRVPYFSEREARARGWDGKDPRSGWGPPSTGELRESGAARLGFNTYTMLVIARGKVDGKVDADVRRVDPSRFDIGITRIRGNITYEHTSPTGEDIALWTHENMLAYEEKPNRPNPHIPPAGRGKGTGPKYLEIPWLANKDEYISALRGVIEDFPNQLRRISKARPPKEKDKFTVDSISITRNDIARLGYYNRFKVADF
uniref:Uncharacterized protein n=2 Tax=viral metagenome TaxID=1070528 RepID=A0A6M3IKH3_9ZZZZ